MDRDNRNVKFVPAKKQYEDSNINIQPIRIDYFANHKLSTQSIQFLCKKLAQDFELIGVHIFFHYNTIQKH